MKEKIYYMTFIDSNDAWYKNFCHCMFSLANNESNVACGSIPGRRVIKRNRVPYKTTGVLCTSMARLPVHLMNRS